MTDTAGVRPPGEESDSPGLTLEADDGTTLTVSSLPDQVGAADRVLAEPLRHNKKNAATAGIWRVDGPLGSAILKVLRPPRGGFADFWPTGDDPGHWNYWRREEVAYSTGLATTAYADAGISAPGLLGCHDRPDGLVELWLDTVSGTEGFDWTVARLARFAYELGVGQARWAGKVPDSTWLSRRWLAQYLAQGPSRSVDVRDADWDDRLVSAWPAPLRHELQRLWRERDRVLAVAETTERTLCHLDVWPANLIDSSGRSVLLDWSFVGEGAVGEDVANLVIDSFTDALMDVSLLPELADAAIEAYLRGLGDGGWSGSPDRVRLAVAACGAAKYCWLGPAVLGRVVSNDLGTSSYNRDGSVAEAAERVTGLLVFLADWARQTRAARG